MIIIAAFLLQSASTATPPSAVAPAPCRVKDARGRLVDADPKLCTAITDYFSRPRAIQTGLEYDVTVEGRVENCRIVEPSGVAELDAKACSAMTEKARFAPEPGKKPKRQKGRRTRITWQTPG